MDLLFLFTLMAFFLPFAVLAGIGYLFFCVLSGILKAAGAVAGVVVAVVCCAVGISAAVVIGILCLPFLAFF